MSMDNTKLFIQSFTGECQRASWKFLRPHHVDAYNIWKDTSGTPF